MSDNISIPPANQYPGQKLSYGSFKSVSASPRATISDVLDIPIRHNTSTYTTPTDSSHNITPPSQRKGLASPNQSKPSIQSHSSIIVQKPNETYLKQHLNLSRSSLMTPDMSHHILEHALQPLMYGTPHHGEAHQIHRGESPIRRVIFNMLNSIIGAGVVGLPYVYSTAGLFGGLFLMVLFAFISAYSLKLLIISAKLCQQNNYEDLCEYLFGLKGYIFVSLTMFVFDFGATLSYLIILGDASSQIMSIWGYDSRFDRQLVVLIISLLIILPTILPRDLSAIEKVSTFSVFSVLLIMVIVIYEWIAYRFLMLQSDEGFNTHVPNDIKWGVDLSGFPMAIGIIAFAFVCHDSSFLLYNTLKNPTVPRWTILAFCGCSAAVVICACFAVPGYLTFGAQVSDNILNNFDTFNPLIIAARCIYCITMALTYPCSFFVVRHVCYAMFHHGPQYTSITAAPTWKHLLFTLPLFAANLVMGLFIEDLGIVMSVSGSLSAVILAFVLPTMCYLRICEYSVFFWTEKGWHRKWRAFKTTAPPALLWLFGVCVATFVTFLTIAQKYGFKLPHV
eukprot:651843_1